MLFNLFIPLSILLSTFFTKGKNISMFLKKFNMCLKVRISGIGKVKNQSIPGGNRVVKGQTVALTLR